MTPRTAGGTAVDDHGLLGIGLRLQWIIVDIQLQAHRVSAAQGIGCRARRSASVTRAITLQNTARIIVALAGVGGGPSGGVEQEAGDGGH